MTGCQNVLLIASSTDTHSPDFEPSLLPTCIQTAPWEESSDYSAEIRVATKNTEGT